MEDFSFSQQSPTAYTIRYVYGGEPFNFDLFMKEGAWILHPFEGILIANREMCYLVMCELFKHKPFQVMLAKQQIPFSDIRSSIDLQNINDPISIINDRDPAPDYHRDEITAFVEENTVEDVIDIECNHLRERIDFYGAILERMFMSGLGPGDQEFDTIKNIVSTYQNAESRISDLLGPRFNNEDRRRW
ncbi:MULTISPECIES: hypothetical protein [Paenibacillus]|uniref:Uncharacterized protein n=1 Tax=Paenibacillus macerans TaxID=44252 RepID=A0A6N8EUU7_PAEMA|nr:hypothetical protein [Paenibacillus macerans]MUG22312.1 hypothetical protein [Paenibacillus macerans]GIP13796.1 hypothetical protein J1TS5_59660 [Paenibacillus macerans]